MISPTNRSQAVELINEAIQNGAPLAAACNEIDICERTYARWRKRRNENGDYADRRTTYTRLVPPNKLSPDEEHQILNTVHEERFASLPPSQIVPILADEGGNYAGDFICSWHYTVQ